ncbi:MFS transporter [Rhodospirillum rubrum]|uniref:MFS transporter n=1 Tax=Rhodospirillum rubrum TaxID=1085 RepID=UPI001902E2EA|nr:MFS transporter [Rhodospirillum rubrum]MBK1663907.1 MFS transporter [Rhodospirillum rubrum]MBK1678251.1 MFS transporter [Rhodospirillum rubrum]
MSSSSAGAAAGAPSLFRQPKAVWATAFAAVIGFTSIGLVDPILTSIAEGLSATPSQVSLLFTSYFFVTAVMMLVTGFVSSRIGGRNTLLLGALLIAVFAALAGTSDSVAELVAYRAGWGLGNAFFVVTALSVIVGAASGGTAGAILLYEAALGLGISAGPLIGAALGAHSWRYPFFGTAALMTIGFLAIAVFLDPQPKPARKIGLSGPLKALRHPGLLTTSVSALFYYYAFFTVLAFAPFVLRLSAHAIGLIFFGWGVALALFSVLVAPRLQARFGAFALLAVSLVGFALLLCVMAFGTIPMIVTAVIASGALMGVNNTVYTEMALEVSEQPRPVASAAYNFLRWFAGVIAPYAASRLGESSGPASAFLTAAGAALIGGAILVALRGNLGRYGQTRQDASISSVPPIGPILVGLDGSAADRAVLARAVALSRQDGGAVFVLHVRPIEVFGEFAAALEDRAAGRAVVDTAVASLGAQGITAMGEVLEDSAALVPQRVIARANALAARTIVLGTRHPGDLGNLMHGSVADIVGSEAGRPVELVPSVAGEGEAGETALEPRTFAATPGHRV